MKVKASPTSAAKAPREDPEPPASRPRRAKRNADAYTAFVVLGAVSTATFLVGGGLTVWSGLRYGKALGSEQLLRSASQSSRVFFEEGGDLSEEARDASASIPGLYGMLRQIEERADEDNQDLQATIRELKDEARATRKKEQKFLLGSAIGAGVGLAGMLIFISAAKIARHRGLMLHGRDLSPRGRRSKVQAQVSPAISPQEFGLSLSLRW